MVALPPTTSIARVFFTLVGLAIAVYVVYLVRDVVALLVVSVFTALALGPAVNFFDRRLPRPAAAGNRRCRAAGGPAHRV